MAKEFGVFALPAILFFRQNSKEPVIYAGKQCTIRLKLNIYLCIDVINTFFANKKKHNFGTGDLYEEDQILNWLMTQKDPGGDVIEDIEGQRLIELIEESGSMAVYFCKSKGYNYG